MNRRMTVEGKETTVEAVLADADSSALLSNEGVMPKPAIRAQIFAPSLKAAPGRSST